MGYGFGHSFPTRAELAAMPLAQRREALALAEEAGVDLSSPPPAPVPARAAAGPASVTARAPVAVLPAGSLHLGRAEIGGAEVTLDVATLLDGRLLVQGASGSGKSWTLRRLLEQAHGIVQRIVLDPEGEFRSLAEADEMFVIEAHRLDIAALALAALRVRQHRLSVLVDLSDMDREAQMAAVAAFLEGLIEAPQEHWHPALVVIDEAHLFAPFGDQSSAAPSIRKAAIGKMTDLMSRGRKRGLSGVLATQRLARLAKSVTSEALNHLVGLNTLDLDIRRAAEMIGWDARRAFDRLPTLGAGEFVAVGPAFSQSPAGIKVAGVRTSHRGARPALSAPAPIDAVSAASLLDIDALVAASAEDGATRDDANKPVGLRAVRAFIRDPAFANAGRLWHALRPLYPEGARVEDLAAHLEVTTTDVAASLALLDNFGAVDFVGAGADRAVRIAKVMV